MRRRETPPFLSQDTMSTETHPAGESAESATPLAEALGGRDRHQTAETHEAFREAGVAPESEPAASPEPAAPKAAKTSDQPAPKAETTPPAPPAPAGQAGDQPDPATAPKEPRWYREHMQKVNRELAAQRAEVERLRAGRQPQPQPQGQGQEPEFPDPVDDPAGFARYIRAETVREQQRFQLETKLDLSERFARQSHGSEAFEECQAWLSTKPELADWCVAQPDPWGAAFGQYQRERLAEEIGDDPNAWRERERERIRAELLAETTAGGGDEPRHTPARRSMTPTAPTRDPPPAPASAVRSAAGMERDGRGRFAGPTPIGAILTPRRGRA